VAIEAATSIMRQRIPVQQHFLLRQHVKENTSQQELECLIVSDGLRDFFPGKSLSENGIDYGRRVEGRSFKGTGSFGRPPVMLDIHLS
jgi:hypothetical protein